MSERATLQLHTVGFTVLVALAGPLRAAEVSFARHLAVSPDGSTLAFSWAGDVWTVPIGGGDATRLTVHPAYEGHPVWSRDGRRLAFSSDRHGAANVFVMNRDGSDVRRLTFSDQAEIPTDWSIDDSRIMFHARREGQVVRESLVYEVSASGGQSWRLIAAYGSDARFSPDGRVLAFVRGSSPWWRRNYRGSANDEIWLCELNGERYVQFTDFDGADRLPMWSADGQGVYIASDRGGPVNIWYQPRDGGQPRQVTSMTVDDVRDASLSADARTLAFTHWDKVYVMTLPDGQPRQIRISAAGDTARNPVELRRFTGDANEAEASPDGKELAIVVRGEVVVARTEPERFTRRVTNAAARDRQVAWSPDGKALYFISDREGQEDVYRALSAEEPPKALSDSLRFRIERVTDNPLPEFGPSISPDGKLLAFTRGRGDLIVRDLASGRETRLLASWNRPVYRWSPDSRWLAWQVEDEEYNPDVWIAPADGSKAAENISRHPDQDGDPQWSGDGQILAFSSRRDGFDTDLYLVFLSPALQDKSAPERAAYFEKRAEKVKKRKPIEKAVASGVIALGGSDTGTQPATSPSASSAAASAPKSAPASAAAEPASQLVRQFGDQLRTVVRSWLKEPGEKKADDDKEDKQKDKDKAEEEEKLAYELDTAWRRIRRVTSLPGDQSEFALAPDGSLLAFVSAHDGAAALYTIKWNGEDTKKVTTGRIGGLQWALDGQRLYFLKGGAPNSCNASGSDSKAHAFELRIAIVHADEAAQKFDDAARTLGANFYHPTLKGLDWPALSAKYRALALQAQTSTEFNEVFNMLQGELNGSHLGITGPSGSPAERIGYLGCGLDRAFPGPGLRIRSITRDSPADRDESRLHPGDVLLTVNGQPVGPAAAIEAALIDTVGEPIILKLQPSSDRPRPATRLDGSATASAPTSSPSSQPGHRDEPLVTRPVSEPADASSEISPPSAVSLAAASGSGSAAASSAAAGTVAGPGPIEVVIRPIGYGEFANLQYEAWVRANREYVEKQSGGRVGYCHILGMSEPSFHNFERDLYAAGYGKEALIIDVRNNGGGWTADWVMAVLSVRRHAYTVTRGGVPGYPQDRLVFYSWTKPATMMCNEFSYSNAEIISHAFKNLKRGPLVGMTTHGAVISTGSYSLIDGAAIRMPTRGWFTLDGTDMELHGAVPDVLAPQSPDDEALGREPQLDAAVRVTLEQLPAARP
jgi:tricorn protease